MSRRISTFITLLVFFAYIAMPLNAAAASAPDITAKNALVLNLDNGHVLYGKNTDKRIAPGVMTALMTAMVAMENLDLDEHVTAGADVRSGLKTISAANVKRGDVLTARDCLYCLLVGGSGEAANALAAHTSGSVGEFVKLMNRRASELGAENTSFANPHGEYDASAYTTVDDMAILIKHALTFPPFLDMSDKTYHKTETVGQTPARELYSTNYILISSMSKYYYRYAEGLLNAYDRTCGYSLATVDDHTGARLLCIVMGSERYTKGGTSYIGSFADSKALLVWAGSNFRDTRLVSMSEPVAQIPVLLSVKHSSVALNAASGLSAVIDVDYNPEKIRREFDLPDKLLAPVEKGQVVGSMTLWYEELRLGQVELCASSDVQVNMLQYYTYHINLFFSNVWVRILSASVILLFGVFIVATIRINRSKRRGKSQRARLRF